MHRFARIPMRRTSLLNFALIVTVVFFTLPASAQWSTPTIDGSIGTGEYGTNNSLQNAGNTGQTWYMTWDATNLYIGIVNANLSEGAVIYVAGNPQNPPTCCSNSDGNLTGFNYDGTDFSGARRRRSRKHAGHAALSPLALQRHLGFDAPRLPVRHRLGHNHGAGR